MKTNVLYILMTIIVMGMVVSAFAGSPDKKPGDNIKKENPATFEKIQLTWQIHVIIDTADENCLAIQYCSPIQIFFQAATYDCEGVLTTPTFTETYKFPITDYYADFPLDIPCVQVSIIAPGCGYPINQNTCCICQAQPRVCTLRICP